MRKIIEGRTYNTDTSAEPQSDLVNRERVSFSLHKDTAEKLRLVSAETAVPMSRIIDKLVRDHLE